MIRKRARRYWILHWVEKPAKRAAFHGILLVARARQGDSQMLSNRISSCGLVAILVVACSNEHDSTGSNRGSGRRTIGDAGTGGVNLDGSRGGGDSSTEIGSTALLAGVIVDDATFATTRNFSADAYPPVSGVKVCIYQNPSVPCATTNSNGLYTIDVPIGPTSYISYEKTGYKSTLYGVMPTSNAPMAAPAIFLSTVEYSNAFLLAAGFTDDPDQGGALFGAVEGGPSNAPTHELIGTMEFFYLSGFTIAVSPSPAADPVYTSDSWRPDRSLKKSSTAGWGFFPAKPGDYTVTFTAPGYSCLPKTTKLVAGYNTTYVGGLCGMVTDDGGIADGGTH